MKLGVRAHDYGRDSASDLFYAISADGWETVQLACRKALAGCNGAKDLTETFLDEIRSELDRFGLTVSVLGCYIEPSLTDESSRRRQVAEFIAHLPAAKALNAGCFGTETTNMTGRTPSERREALTCLRRSLAQILPEAQRLGVVVAVEPVYYHTLATPEDARELLRDMASDRLQVIFDPVNLLAPEEAEGQRDLWDRSFDCFGEKIAAVHVKRLLPEKAAPGIQGLSVDWDYIFSRLREISMELPILREEAVPAKAATDIAFMRALISGNPQ